MKHYVVTKTESWRFLSEDWDTAKGYIGSENLDPPDEVGVEMVEEETGREEPLNG